MANKLRENSTEATSIVATQQKATETPPPPKDEFKPEKKEPEISTLYAKRKKWRIVGMVILFLTLIWFLSMISFLFSWRDDFDKIQEEGFSFLFTHNIGVENIMGRIGLWLAYHTVYLGFGVPCALLCWICVQIGGRLFFKNFKPYSVRQITFYVLWMIYASILLAFVFSSTDFLYGGYVGLLLTNWSVNFVGGTGVTLFLLSCPLGYAIWSKNLTINYAALAERWKKITTPAFKPPDDEMPEDEPVEHTDPIEPIAEEPPINIAPQTKEVEQEVQPEPKGNTVHEEYQFKELHIQEPVSSIKKGNDEHSLLNIQLIEQKLQELQEENPIEPIIPAIAALAVQQESEEIRANVEHTPTTKEEDPSPNSEEQIEFDISIPSPEEEIENDAMPTVHENQVIIEENNTYKFPPASLLKKYDTDEISIDENELESNKKQIIHTLKNFKINIQKIAATIGPTVTLYEIVPEEGTRISKIKNLEDDIALSLSALGIRIIAPMPGKGTIGIEVPNLHKRMVSLRTLVSSTKFTNAKHILPVAFGKTIDNSDFIVDLAKMPHLLMAGATGQGKSVGLNALLVSLLYKKHPSDLKLVLIDPKKVELTLFSRIEKHFLAKLPGESDAIITDTKKVIHVLNALCIEMDNRYDLLKDAYCRNIEEYNIKFKEQKLDPTGGHQYLPYIVVVIDEFADLIMTAGKEVEIPIARLAQLARAIGIHLVIATQRPSVNIITGMIKANFPSRIGFKVSSRIDSRTILDEGGAEQLIGKGDMLISQSGNLVRLQCAFVDTAEVENICAFIAEQAITDEPYLLPQYEDPENDNIKTVSAEDRDALFEEVARLVVNHQSGSTSFIQRKMKLGFNRAGRLMDQLEAAGIVSPAKGAKPRDVLVKTEAELDQLLHHL